MRNELTYNYYSSVQPKNVQWLWYPYIPYGKITIVQGDPGEGKSTFMINIAALASKGAPMPDGAAIPAPITVIYQCAEDDISDTIKPRLLAAGADCDKVAYIEEAGNVLSLDDDRIESVLKQTMARLLVLDPIQSFLSQDGDMQSAGRMRLILGKLSDIAARTHCAIVLIGHLNKSVGGKQLYRGLGSIDIAAIARSVLLIGRSKSDPDLRYMQPIKTSLAPEGKAISFSFQEDGSLEWNGYYEITEEDTEDFSSEPRRYSIAKQIIELLSGQDYPSTEILEMLGEIGVSRRTAYRVKQSIGVEAYKKGNTWFWRLPSNAEIKEETEGDVV